MSEKGLYALIALIVGGLIYTFMGKFSSKADEYEAEMDSALDDMKIALDLSRECIKEAQETNRLLKDIKELLEKK